MNQGVPTDFWCNNFKISETILHFENRWNYITKHNNSFLQIQFYNHHGQWVFSGALVLTGCTNAYVLIECPMDDTVEVTDVRITSPQKGSPCAMTEPDFFFWKVRQSYIFVFIVEEECSYKTNNILLFFFITKPSPSIDQIYFLLI